MNANSRTARRTLAARRAQTRAQASLHRHGSGTLATYGIAAGLDTAGAHSVAGSLRNAARKLGIEGTAGTTFRKGRRRECRRYSVAQVAQIAAKYAPRKAEYKTARQYLLAA